MRFSIKVQYAIQAMLELAIKYSNEPVQISEIAQTQKIPARYLEQLLLTLKRRGLVVSARGKNGGYSLAKHAGDIPILEIIEALEGRIEFAAKKMKKVPVLFEAFEEIEKNVRKSLMEKSLEDLVFRKRQRERAYVYNI